MCIKPFLALLARFGVQNEDRFFDLVIRNCPTPLADWR